MHCRKRQSHFVHVGADLVVARDDERREVLLVDGRVAEGRGRDTRGGDAGYLGASLECAGEVRHYWICNKCTDRCWILAARQNKARNRDLASCKTLAKSILGQPDRPQNAGRLGLNVVIDGHLPQSGA